MMKISTRVNYGLRLMVQLAVRQGHGFVFLKDIARREGISVKYLSQIMIPLRASGLVLSSRGIKGGYVLASAPSAITVRQVIEALEGAIATVRPRERPRQCETAEAVTRAIWDTLGHVIVTTLDALTLEQLVESYRAQQQREMEYQI